MQIRGTPVTIETSPIEIWNTLRHAILRKHGMQNVEYSCEVDGKRVFKADDCEAFVISKPSDTQLAVWDSIKQLEKLADFRNLGVE